MEDKLKGREREREREREMGGGGRGEKRNEEGNEYFLLPGKIIE